VHHGRRVWKQKEPVRAFRYVLFAVAAVAQNALPFAQIQRTAFERFIAASLPTEIFVNFRGLSYRAEQLLYEYQIGSPVGDLAIPFALLFEERPDAPSELGMSLNVGSSGQFLELHLSSFWFEHLAAAALTAATTTQIADE
ncbi:MAG TPA: hypothetical protein VNA04_17465, partial [Thermoanaerobaculia bacterium]|nr:hypothetical protein [Thermoanaerobaculia bacterium]